MMYSVSLPSEALVLISPPSPIGGVRVPRDLESGRWSACYFELAHDQGLPETSLTIEKVLHSVPENMWSLEWNPSRQGFELTLLLNDNEGRRAIHSMEVVEALCRTFREQGLWAAAGLGSPGPGTRLPQSYQEARLVWGRSLVAGEGAFQFDAAREVTKPAGPALQSVQARLLSALRTAAPWEPVLDEYLGLLSTSTASTRRLLHEVQEVFSRLADELSPSPRAEGFYHIGDSVRGPVQLRQALVHLCTEVREVVHEQGWALADRKVAEFRDLVASDYGGDLNLGSICRCLHISSSYLGRLVKKHLGTSIVGYLTQVRVDRAKELLASSDLLTCQIAERVGFGWPHYFSALFKRHTGQTPGEYRAAFRAEGRAALCGSEAEPVGSHGIVAENFASSRFSQGVEVG